MKRLFLLCMTALLSLSAVSCSDAGSKKKESEDPEFFCDQFEDSEFAESIATALGLDDEEDLTQEDLDRFEGLIYYCDVGVDTTDGYTPYAYPVVMLCDSTYANALMEQSDPDYRGEGADDVDYSQNFVRVPYHLTNPEDLNLFRNLRMLRIFDQAEINTMLKGCQMTLLYQMYGVTQQSYELAAVVNASKMDEFTNLTQISSLTKLEQLSIGCTGITSLEGIESFPNLNKLDATYAPLTGTNGLAAAQNLTFLNLNSIGSGPNAEMTNDFQHGNVVISPPEKEDSQEVVYNTAGLTNDDVTIIAKLPNLKYLDIANNNVTDLSALSALSNVKYLSVAQNPVTSLNGVENMKGLKLLHAPDCKLTEIDAVTGFDKLETVFLSNNSITSLAPLTSATLVTSLDASENELTDIGAVSGMTKLTSLVLNDNRITTLPDMSALDRLGSLDVSENNLTDVSGLEKFDPKHPGMTDKEIEAAEKEEEEENTITINLSDNRIPCISLTASKLGSLDLSKNNLTTEDRDSALIFKGCDKLAYLSLSENDKLTSLKGIETLTGLNTLNASKSAIEIIPQLKELKKLTTVNLSETNIADINGLKDNESITTLTLTECEKLVDISILNTIKKLSTVNLANCTGLTNQSIRNAFGSCGVNNQEVELKFDKRFKMTITLTGCHNITDYAVFSFYTNMKVDYGQE